jgi:hypothetical protein
MQTPNTEHLRPGGGKSIEVMGPMGPVRVASAQDLITPPWNAGLPRPDLPAAPTLPPRDTGNIDLTKRPLVPNQGGYSTVNSVTFEEDGKSVVVPGVSHDGKSVLSPKEAIDQYHQREVSREVRDHGRGERLRSGPP